MSIDTKEVDEAEVKAEAEEAAKKHGLPNMGPMIPPELQGKMAKKAKSTIPEEICEPRKEWG